MANERDEDENTFKVVDRRRFTSSGETRDDVPPREEEMPPRIQSETTSQAKVGSPQSNESGSSRVTSGPSAADVGASIPQTSDARKSEIERSYKAEGETSVEFSEFVISLATQAMVLLGEMQDPHTRQLTVNLEAARQTIDILGAIEKKTKGNLTAEEAHLLSEALATIRLAYVRKSQPSQPSK